MSLRQLNIDGIYRKKDDVLNTFYIPTLSKAKNYKRVSAYFSSDVLKLYSKGISSIIKNDGKIKFIFSHHISEEDYVEIKKGYDARYDEVLLKALDDVEDSVQISNLAYLISKGYVEIKFGFVSPGTLHFKFGLIDDGNDVVCFRGSTNETPAGLLLNGENFEVSCSRLCSERERSIMKNYEDDFNSLWNNKYDGVVTVDAPRCVLNRIENYSKNNLILDYENETENTFVLDLDEKLKLIGYSFLKEKWLLSPATLFYKTQIGYAIESIENQDVFRFNEMKWADIKEIIDTFTEYGKEKGFEVHISNKLRSYLEDVELYLDKRVSLGNAIKNKDEIVFSQFEEFKNIVNEELSRRLAEPQMWDAFHAANMIASCNFSVPGTGKTTIAYGAFGYLSSKKNGFKIKRIIMVGPKNSFMAWKNEFELCFGNKRKLKLFNVQDPIYKNTNQRISGLLKNYDNSNLILINYDMLQNVELLNVLKDLMIKDHYSDYLILDEAHKIKGFDGTRAKAVLSLAPLAKYKLLLTGTPIPNSYLDIYNMLHILYGDNYDNFFGFSASYLESASYIPSKQNEINKKIYPFFCRTTKTDLSIPTATFDYESGYILMNEDEKYLFSLVYKYFSHNVLVLYIRLLQASINPLMLVKSLQEKEISSLFDECDIDDEICDDKILKDNLNRIKASLRSSDKTNDAFFDPEESNFLRTFGFTRKFYRGIEIIENLVSENKTVVAWGVFVDTLQSIHGELESRGIKSVVISGTVPLSEREDKIKRFINGEYQVLISNPHTLAESVSLHKTCHEAVYFEYTFNLTHLLQSRDRIHRLGLEAGTKTTYYFLSIDNGGSYNSIDLKTLKRLQIKEERMLNAVEAKQLFIKPESFKEDIEFIFSK